MIIQTRSVLADILRKLPAAGSNPVKLSEKLDRVPYSRRIDIRAVIERFILLHAPCEHNTWKRLIDRHTDVRVALIILEHGIILWPVLFD